MMWYLASVTWMEIRQGSQPRGTLEQLQAIQENKSREEGREVRRKAKHSDPSEGQMKIGVDKNYTDTLKHDRVATDSARHNNKMGNWDTGQTHHGRPGRIEEPVAGRHVANVLFKAGVPV